MAPSDVRLVLVVTLIGSAFIVLFLGVIAWGKRTQAGPAAVYLSVCFFAVSVYNFGYALEISSNTLPDILFWVRVQHLGIHVITPSWLLCSLYLTGRERLITPPRLVLLLIIPSVLLITSQTLGSLNILHPNPRLNTTGPFNTFTYDRGFLIYLGAVFQWFCLVITTVFYSIMFVRSAPAFRKQAFIFVLASLISLFSALIYNLNLSSYNIDTTPFTLSLSGLLFMMGFLRFHLLDIVPLARDVIFEGMDNGILVLDTGDRMIDLNPCFRKMLPNLEKVVVGAPAVEALRTYPALVQIIRENSSETAELEIPGLDAPHFYQGNLSPLYDRRKNNVGKILTLHDYTQVKHLLRQLEDQARLDALTGLFNRRYFKELAVQEVYRLRRYGKALSLIMFDLDHFKNVNDTYGHEAGDKALQSVVEICRKGLRQSDIMGRWGGEEFVILLPDTTLVDGVTIAQRLCVSLEHNTIQTVGSTFIVTASFGVTGTNSCDNYLQEDLLEQLFRKADSATYMAKDTGRNRVCVETLSVA